MNKDELKLYLQCGLKYWEAQHSKDLESKNYGEAQASSASAVVYKTILSDLFGEKIQTVAWDQSVPVKPTPPPIEFHREDGKRSKCCRTD